MHHLREANETLKKYSHVNKKALDQYLSFSEQRKQLLSRKEEMEKVEKDVCVCGLRHSKSYVKCSWF